MNKTFAYCRVSSEEQNESRQVKAMLDFVTDDRDIYIDKCSGKDFERPQYQALKHNLREGDTLIIKSIDRLGRNYKQICNEWREITQEIRANIKVLDTPLLDTTKDEGLLKDVISGIVLQLLGYVAEQEREFIKQRQAEGIKIAKAKGVKMGRPAATYPKNWNAVYSMWKDGKITAVQAMKDLNLKPSTFYKLVRNLNK